MKNRQKGKVLITEKIHPILAKVLTQNGWKCTHYQQITYKEVIAAIPAYNGLIVRSGIRVDRALIDQAPNLQFIGRTGSGMEHIDITYAQQKGIICLNSPEGNRDAVAEHTLGMLLSLLHKIAKADRELRRGEWHRKANTGIELRGKTVGIVGYGNMGHAFAQRLQGFSVKILAHDKYKTGFGNQYVEEAQLTDLFEQADIISIHLPLTPETHYFINNNFVRQFAKPIFLLNTSRGGILHTQEILDALEQRQLLGLGLDVFENENRQTFSEKDEHCFERLSRHPNVVMTPHTAGWSQQSTYNIAYILAEKIVNIFR